MGSATPRDAPVPGARLRGGWLSLLVGGAVFAGKLLAFGVTGSSAVLSDAMESVVNVAAAALLVYSLVVAARPADRDHPYGHGKVEFFCAGVEGGLIVMAALLIVVQAAGELVRGPELARIHLGLAILLPVTALNGALGMHLVRLGRATNSIALEADGRHLFTDVWTSLGVVGGLLAVWLTGWAILDPLVALGVAVHILAAGWRLVRRAVGGLMDEADTAALCRVVDALEAAREPSWIDVHGLRAWRSGALQHVDFHLSVPRFLDVDRVHEINDAIEEKVLAAMEAGGDVLIHFDPCRPRQCPSCALPNCGVRQAPLVRRAPLTLERAVRREEVLDTGEPAPEVAP